MVAAKSGYRAVSSLEVFYTGGPVVAFPDGSHVACACGDEVKIVDLSTGAVVRTLPGDSEPVTALAISPDGQTLFSASRALLVRAWSTATGRPVQSFSGHKAPVAAMVVDSTGTLLATASADHHTRVFDIAGGFCTHSFGGHRGVVLAAAFHPRELMLVTAGDDAEVRVWDLMTKSCSHVLKTHFSAVTALAMSGDGWTLVSGSRDGVCCTWDLRTGTKLGTTTVLEAVEGVVVLDPRRWAPTLRPALKPHAVVFATGGERGVVRIWRSDTGACLRVLTDAARADGTASADRNAHAQGLGIVDLLLLRVGTSTAAVQQLVAATQDGCLLFFDGMTPDAAMTTASTTSQSPTRLLVGNNDEVTDVRFVERRASGAEASTSCAAVASNASAIRLFSLPRFDCVGQLTGHDAAVLALDAVSVPGSGTSNKTAGSPAPALQLLASGSKDCNVRVWDVGSARCLALGEGHVGAVAGVAFCPRPAGTLLASAGADRLLKLWDVAPAVSASAGGSSEGRESSDVVDNDGPAIDSKNVLRLRAVAATAAHDKDVNAVTFSPDGRLVATASADRTAKLWRAPDLVPVATLRGHRRGVWAVAFSPVDQVLATASADGTARLWSARDGSCLRTLEGHSASVLRVSWASAGAQLLTTGADGLLKLWAAGTGECDVSVDAADAKIWALDASSPAADGAGGGAALLSGSADGRVALWRDATAATRGEAAAADAAAAAADQAYQNALMSRDWAAAAAAAIARRQPRRLLAVVDAVLAGSSGVAVDGSATGDAFAREMLEGVTSALDEESLPRVLECVRDWNTHSRSCHAAAALLSAVLRTWPAQELAGLRGVGQLVEGLTPYTQRHAQRLDRLSRAAFLLDHVLESGAMLEPMDAEAAGAAL